MWILSQLWAKPRELNQISTSGLGQQRLQLFQTGFRKQVWSWSLLGSNVVIAYRDYSQTRRARGLIWTDLEILMWLIHLVLQIDHILSKPLSLVPLLYLCVCLWSYNYQSVTLETENMKSYLGWKVKKHSLSFRCNLFTFGHSESTCILILNSATLS